jgi:hypothetical protein
VLSASSRNRSTPRHSTIASTPPWSVVPRNDTRCVNRYGGRALRDGQSHELAGCACRLGVLSALSPKCISAARFLAEQHSRALDLCFLAREARAGVGLPRKHTQYVTHRPIHLPPHQGRTSDRELHLPVTIDGSGNVVTREVKPMLTSAIASTLQLYVPFERRGLTFQEQTSFAVRPTSRHLAFRPRCYSRRAPLLHDAR